MDVDHVSVVVAACCVLHNICETHGDTFNEEWIEGVERYEHECPTAIYTHMHTSQSAASIRNAFTSYFST